MYLNFSLHTVKSTKAKCRGLLCQLEGALLLKGDVALKVEGAVLVGKAPFPTSSLYCRRCATDAASFMKSVVEWQKGPNKHMNSPITKTFLILEG